MQYTSAKDRRTPLFDTFLMDSSDIDALNELLRGEISAAETYSAALEKFEGHPAILDLQYILGEHRAAASALRERIRMFGGDPASSSGIWGEFASAVAGTAKVFGMRALLAVLRRGEEHGIAEYQRILNNADLTVECINLIDGDLLPRCRYHVAELQRLIEDMS